MNNDKNDKKNLLIVLVGVGIGIFIILVAILILVFFNIPFFNYDKTIKSFIGYYDSTVDKYDKKYKEETKKNNEEFNNTTKNDDYLREIFNNNLLNYGVNYGGAVKEILSNASSSLNENPEHPISIVYNNQVYSDSNSISRLINQIDDLTNYNILYEYDSNKYINKIIIEKK